MRECSKCLEHKSEESYSKSVWNSPKHYTVICRECSKMQKRKQKRNVRGYIYIIKNSAWEEWCKIGITTVSPEARLLAYQTSSPFRDYYLAFSILVDDVHYKEVAIHDYIAKECDYELRNEWAAISTNDAIEIITMFR